MDRKWRLWILTLTQNPGSRSPGGLWEWTWTPGNGSRWDQEADGGDSRGLAIRRSKKSHAKTKMAKLRPRTKRFLDFPFSEPLGANIINSKWFMIMFWWIPYVLIAVITSFNSHFQPTTLGLFFLRQLPFGCAGNTNSKKRFEWFTQVFMQNSRATFCFCFVFL